LERKKKRNTDEGRMDVKRVRQAGDDLVNEACRDDKREPCVKDTETNHCGV